VAGFLVTETGNLLFQDRVSTRSWALVKIT
jgi:hypothetical protein